MLFVLQKIIYSPKITNKFEVGDNTRKASTNHAKSTLHNSLAESDAHTLPITAQHTLNTRDCSALQWDVFIPSTCQCPLKKIALFSGHHTAHHSGH